ncbi:hypothetical protein THARTR1_00675 [Trichoderma harzianum]|uniref:Uncharacterized protein n=1 Tax=Trichoderma harzianum TaxID=5544 RepID=A0A2K0UPT2_TRIHA|nr:hypothetical protein THARTR1_00675 [Trichoderma harzianum]
MRTDLPYEGLPLMDEQDAVRETAIEELDDDGVDDLSMEDGHQTDNHKVQQFDYPRAYPREPTPPVPIITITR